MRHAFGLEVPRYPSGVPRALAAIAQRALARDASERWESADALREAVEAFLRHRGAEHLAAHAEEIEVQIDARVTQGEDPEAEFEPLFAECDVAIAEVRRKGASHPRLEALDGRAPRERPGRDPSAEQHGEQLVPLEPVLVRDVA